MPSKIDDTFNKGLKWIKKTLLSHLARRMRAQWVDIDGNRNSQVRWEERRQDSIPKQNEK